MTATVMVCMTVANRLLQTDRRAAESGVQEMSWRTIPTAIPSTTLANPAYTGLHHSTVQPSLSIPSSNTLMRTVTVTGFPETQLPATLTTITSTTKAI